MKYSPNADSKLVSRAIQVPADLTKTAKDRKARKVWVAVGDKEIVRKQQAPKADLVIKVATQDQLKWAYENGYTTLVEKTADSSVSAKVNPKG